MQFKDRPRYPLEKIIEWCKTSTNGGRCAIEHIIDNEDGTYSMMFHIVCEHCDYCDEQGDCRDIIYGNEITIFPKAKENPYENQERAIAEWDNERLNKQEAGVAEEF